jgi:hypothetical protein
MVEQKGFSVVCGNNKIGLQLVMGICLASL